MLVHRYKISIFTKQKYSRLIYSKIIAEEADCQDTMLWKLNTTIYGLNDTSISWYLNDKKEHIGLGAIVCKSDPAVFLWHNQSKVNGFYAHMLMISSLGELNFF